MQRVLEHHGRDGTADRRDEREDRQEQGGEAVGQRTVVPPALEMTTGRP
jgi:hypothetical protein